MAEDQETSGIFADVVDFGGLFSGAALLNVISGDVELDRGNVNLSNSPTLSDMATQQGVILGTAAYMSPEQAKGKAVDKRADIWAFGVVLFEMLTGRQVFTGETVSDTLASVLAREPQWQRLPPNLHPRIRFLLERCLEKETKNRYHDIADARADIQKVLANPGGVFAQQVTTLEPQTKSRQILLWASITIILTILAGTIIWYLRSPEQLQEMQLEYSLLDNQQLHLSPIGRGFIDVSPDGNQFVYSTTQGLYLRAVDKLKSKRIPGSEDITEHPFFSPDGRWIGYYSPSDQKLKKIAINGGIPIPLCDAPGSFSGGQWIEGKTIIFSTLWGGGIMKIPDSGGTPEPLFNRKTTFSTETGTILEVPVLPTMLPDQENVLFTDISDLQNMQIMVQSIKTGEKKTLFPGMAARYIPTGHILYGLSENNITKLYAIPFDLDSLEVTGGAVTLVEGYNDYSVSDSGTLAYITEPVAAAKSDIETSSTAPQGPILVWVDREGHEEPLGTPTAEYNQPKISPDGKFVAVSMGMPSDIQIWDLGSKTMRRLTFDEGFEITPVWTPNGDRILYTLQTEQGGIYCKNADGTGQAELLVSLLPERTLWPYSWSRDGKTLVMGEMLNTEEEEKFDISILSMEGDHSRKLLLQEDYIEALPQISPDGHWLAYCSNETGQDEVFVRPFPDVENGQFQLSTRGAYAPLWSPDGKELYYLIKKNTLTEAVMAVDVETTPTFKFGSSTTLFKGAYIAGAGSPWDTHDGKRFLMIKPPVAAPLSRQPKIVVFLNLDVKLKQEVPAD